MGDGPVALEAQADAPITIPTTTRVKRAEIRRDM